MEQEHKAKLQEEGVRTHPGHGMQEHRNVVRGQADSQGRGRNEVPNKRQSPELVRS